VERNCACELVPLAVLQRREVPYDGHDCRSRNAYGREIVSPVADKPRLYTAWGIDGHRAQTSRKVTSEEPAGSSEFADAIQLRLHGVPTFTRKDSIAPNIYIYRAVQPPSTGKDAPVMNEAASEQSQITVCAISSGVAMRPIGSITEAIASNSG
jgi:hypothetical protein